MTVNESRMASRRQSNYPPVPKPLSVSSVSTLANQSCVENQEFTILKTLFEGTFSTVLLARPEAPPGKTALEQSLVLKALSKEYVPWDEFHAELSTNYFLSPHPNILTSYNVSFSWDKFNVFPTEYALFGDLSKFLRSGRLLQEDSIKSLARQLSSALEFMHSVNLVHRNIIPENVLVFKRDLSLIKISDFSSTVSSGALLTKNGETSSTPTPPACPTDSPTLGSKDRSKSVEITQPKSRKSWNNGCGDLAYLPPEVASILPQEKYYCYPSWDVWQVGILLFVCLSGGSVPWRSADALRDSSFSHYSDWTKRKNLKAPTAFQPFSVRFVRLLKRLLELKASQRAKITEISKYLKDDWLNSSASRTPAFSRSNSSNNNSTNEEAPSPNASSSRRLSLRKKSLCIASSASTRKRSERIKNRESSSKDQIYKISCTFHNTKPDN